MNFTHLRSHFSLPLLEKELIEQAARKRTYQIRAGYACLLFFVAFLIFYDALQAGVTSPLAVLGRGRDMFSTLVYLQFAGIYLFMPAITCGVITQEKERDSLQLLLITRLEPWTILFEKLLGRLVPMICFLLLSLPLLGFAYSLGGISPRLLWTGVWMLVLAVLQMGTLALASSAFFRTTVGAFIATYVVAFLTFFGPYVTWMILYLGGLLLGIDFEKVWDALNLPNSPGVFIVGAFPFFGPPFFLALTQFPGGLGFWPLAAHSAIILVTCALCLWVARQCVVSRAFLPPRNFLLEFFRFLDRTGARRSAARHSPAVAPAATDPALLPDDSPIAWRETSKRTLGRARYRFRILLFTEIPLLLLCGLLALSALHEQYSIVPRVMSSMLMLALWALAVLIISVQAASLIAGERSHQTLDVLCTTPVSGREILLQKFRAVWRLIIILAAPFMTLAFFEAWLRDWTVYRRNWAADQFSPSFYLVCQALSLAVYLPLVAWLSLAIGLRVRTQPRAIVGSMATIVAWCVAPFVFIVIPLAIYFQGRGPSTDPVLTSTMLLSPATILFWNEIDTDIVWRQYGKEFEWLPVVINFSGYLVALFLVRRSCLRNADRWLGRAEENSSNAARGGPLSALRAWLGTMEREGQPETGMSE